MTKAIIAGGRNFRVLPKHFLWLDELHARLKFTEVVSGCASGADRAGEEWASKWNLPLKLFPAEWSKHGRAAGPVRNRQMAKYVADHGGGCVILFPGGNGTESMRRSALALGLPVCDYVGT